jgi:hypothetical protein
MSSVWNKISCLVSTEGWWGTVAGVLELSFDILEPLKKLNLGGTTASVIETGTSMPVTWDIEQAVPLISDY